MYVPLTPTEGNYIVCCVLLPLQGIQKLCHLLTVKHTASLNWPKPQFPYMEDKITLTSKGY